MFKALGFDRSVLVAINGRNENVDKSASNIDRTTLTTVEQLNAWDILKNRTLLMTRDGLDKILA
jgi:ribosomal protein L4